MALNLESKVILSPVKFAPAFWNVRLYFHLNHFLVVKHYFRSYLPFHMDSLSRILIASV